METYASPYPRTLLEALVDGELRGVPESLVPVAHALRASLPTSRHAELLFDLLVDLLGDQAVVTTENGRTLFKLFRRDVVDAGRVVPWPVAQLSTAGRIGWVSPTVDTRTGEVVPEREAPAGRARRLRGLGRAEVEVYDGTARVSVLYGDDGTATETSLNDLVPNRLGELLAALASRRAQSAELVADVIAALDPGRHGPGRITWPVPVPCGPVGAWLQGLASARRALYDGRVPATARHLVVDGIAGTALGWGRTLDEANVAFERAVEQAPPSPSRQHQTAWDDYDDDGTLLRRGRPVREDDLAPWESDDPWVREDDAEPEPDAPPGLTDLGGGLVRLTGPTPDVEMPVITVESVPRVILPLAGSPTVPAPLGRWERTIGACGATGHVARAVTPTGFVQLGERLRWRVDPRTLDAALEDADQRDASFDALLAQSPMRRFVRFKTRSYQWADAQGDRPARLERTRGSYGPRFDAAELDGDVEVASVRRLVRIPRDAARG